MDQNFTPFILAMLPHNFTSRTSTVVMASWILFVLCIVSPLSNQAQDFVTGALEGLVVRETGEPIADATVQITNQDIGRMIVTRTDSKGRFYQGLLPPGTYTVIVSAPGFKARQTILRLMVLQTNELI